MFFRTIRDSVFIGILEMYSEGIFEATFFSYFPLSTLWEGGREGTRIDETVLLHHNMSQFTSIIRSSRGGAKKIFLPNWSPFKLFESMLSCHSTHIHYTTGHSDFVKPGFNNFNVPQYSAV